MELYTHQNNTLLKIKQAYKSGYKSPVLVASCGFGKTCCAAEITKRSIAKGNRVLIFAHRIEIVEQIKQAFVDWGVNMSMCDVTMVAGAKKLKTPPDFIICDECHHATCKTYTDIFDMYPKAKRLLLTATPERTNGDGLGNVADIIIETATTQWLIDNNFLAQFEYYAPKTLVDVAKMKISRGDYEQNDIIDQIDKPKIYGDIITNYQKYANGKKTIAFCSSIEHSVKTAKAFNAIGIPAEHLDGKTGKIERVETMKRFRSGETMILCNYEIISEGVSINDCECCLLIRPTQSLILHIQSSMRCLRYLPGKTAIILDFVGNFERHSLPNSYREWSLENKPKKKKTEEKEVKARLCNYCFKIYAGINPICPYCGKNNGKTREQIRIDETAELERITEQNKLEDKKQLKIAGESLPSLIAYGKSKNYAEGWAYNRFKILKRYK